MARYTAPGVYVEEVPGARSISGVSTDVAAFVGITEFGDEDKPTLITSWNEYQQKFGGFMWNRYVPMAVYNFFMEGGAQCYVVRTSTGDMAEASATSSTAGNKIGLKFTAKTPGSWANTISIGISTRPVSKWDAPVSFNVQVLQKPFENSFFTSSLQLSDLMIDRYIVSNKASDAAAEIYPASFYTSNRLPSKTKVLEEFVGFTKEDLKMGPDSNLVKRINSTSIFIKVSMTSMLGAHTLPGPSLLTLSGGTKNAGSLSYTDALNSLDPILSFSTMAMPDAVDGTTYSVPYKDGWDWNLNKITIKDAVKTKTLSQDMLTKLQGWKRVFSVLDAPYGYDVSGVVGYKTGSGTNAGTPLNSTYGAIYYPWMQAANPYTAKFIWVPPSGQTLGRYAATDRAIGVWKAPAGVESGKVLTASALTREITQAQQEILNPEGVDAIRAILNYGICIYGARTVSLDPEWRYVPVRRLAIYIEQSLFQALQWVVFEPNSPALWGRVSRDVTNFMTRLWRDGALFGTSAAEAFFVVCDASNNPPEERDEGYLYIDVGFAPVKPAEFVVIRLSQMTLSA